MNTDKHGLEKVAPLEVIDAKESAAILKRCEEKIHSASGMLKRGERMNDGLRFVIGTQMVMAKPHVPHGNEKGDGFQEWLKAEFPEIEYRTAANWMKFSETVFLVAEKSKSETVSFFKALPERLGQHEFDFGREVRTITEAVDGVMGEVGMMDFIDKHAEKKPKGGLRKISFSCPHCSTKNTGLFGREVTCVNCLKKIKVKPDIDPEKLEKRLTEEANNATGNLNDEFVAFFETLAAQEKNHDGAFTGRIDNPTWHKLVANIQRAGRLIAEAKKLRGKSRAKQTKEASK